MISKNIPMKANGSMIYLMAMVNKYGKMVPSMQVNLSMELKMEKDNWNSALMKAYIVVFSKMINSTVKDNSLSLMVPIKDTSWMGKWKERGYLNIVMVHNMMESTKTTKSMVLVST